MLKKITAVLLAVIMGCTVFAGCSKTDVSSTATSNSGSSASKGKTTLTMFTFSEGVPQTIQNSPILKQLEENTGIDLKITCLSGASADDKRNIMIASQDYPDILDSVDERFIDAGALVPLDDLINKDAPNIKKHFGTSLTKLRYTDGKIYYIGSPVNREQKLIDANTSCLLVQYDVLKEAGYPTPKTLDDAFNIIKQYAGKHPKVNGQSVIPWGLWADSWGYNQTVNNPALWINGFTDDSDAYVNQSTYDVKYFDTTNYFKTYLTFLNKLHNNGMLNENSFIQKYDEFNAEIASGRVLAMYDAPCLISDAEASLRHSGMSNRCYARFPITVNSSVKDRSQVTCESYDNGMAITTKCKNPDAAMKFMDYINSTEGNILLNWGIKGVHYDVVNGKRVQKADVTKKYNSDQNYRWEQGLNCLTWWPLYTGSRTLDDGDYASPNNLESFYSQADGDTKTVLDKYKIKNWGQMFDTSGKKTAYGYAWTIPIQSGSAAETANKKADEYRHIMVPKIVLSNNEQEFDSKWNEFTKNLYSQCKISDWEAEMSKQIKKRITVWSK